MSLFYSCSDSIEILEIDQEWIVMDTEQFTITKINTMGAYILEAVQAKKPLDQIVDMIHTNFNVEQHDARKDALAFLEELNRMGLVTHG